MNNTRKYFAIAVGSALGYLAGSNIADYKSARLHANDGIKLEIQDTWKKDERPKINLAVQMGDAHYSLIDLEEIVQKYRVANNVTVNNRREREKVLADHLVQIIMLTQAKQQIPVDTQVTMRTGSWENYSTLEIKPSNKNTLYDRKEWTPLPPAQ